VFRLRAASRARLDHILARADSSELTYAEVGSTRDMDLPEGYRHDRAALRIGNAEHFDRAREGLVRWQPHVGAGAAVYPDDAPSENRTVLVTITLGPFRAIAPCRVVYVIDEPDRFGLAYGTLPGHPERGEESFVIERHGDDVVFRITAFSRPADFLTRLGAPLARRVQVRFTDGYLHALERYVSFGGPDQEPSA
jgi:uncharacterized protein (UPF0548 family)